MWRLTVTARAHLAHGVQSKERGLLVVPSGDIDVDILQGNAIVLRSHLRLELQKVRIVRVNLERHCLLWMFLEMGAGDACCSVSVWDSLSCLCRGGGCV